jgi:hypothetical protein
MRLRYSTVSFNLAASNGDRVSEAERHGSQRCGANFSWKTSVLADKSQTRE